MLVKIAQNGHQSGKGKGMGTESNYASGLFPASMDKLYDMLDYIRIRAQDAGFDSYTVAKIELAVEEALVNIIEHGYAGKPGDIQISCTHDTTHLAIKLHDRGIPYNPVNQGTRGCGTKLMLQLMDDVSYHHEHDTNQLILIKKLF